MTEQNFDTQSKALKIPTKKGEWKNDKGKNNTDYNNKEAIIMAIIYKPNAEAIEKEWDWDTIFTNNAIEIVEEFDSVEDALKACDERGYDEDLYGVF